MNLKIFLFLVLPCALLSKMSNARSTMSRRLFYGGISEFRMCGSNLVDILRFVCELEMWSSEMCLRAKGSFCKNRPNQDYALCSSNCTIQPLSILIADFNEDNIRIKKSTPENSYSEASIEEIFEYFFIKMRNQHRRRRQEQNVRMDSRRTRRTISENCCRKKCSIQFLASYCPNVRYRPRAGHRRISRS